MEDRFNKRYISGDLPWNIERPDFNLVNVVQSFPVKSCRALDVGCGTGDNAIWLIKQGFEVTGVDLSEKAIEIAKEKVKNAGVDVSLYVNDFLNEKVPGTPFGFIFDRGCFHTFDKKEERNIYAKNVHQFLETDGLWLCLIGNYDDGRLDTGPPKSTALDVVSVVEPFFEILSLTQGEFDSDDENPSKIWICMMRKR
ncbi:MAG: methyltransferase type 11 [Bacteroidetes bacterium 4484_249]|nr:MAG: methyltransferase type 11 [Bacteroidetes bacterium 4484_249]